jgi:RNase P/RNase MRP subunit p29
MKISGQPKAVIRSEAADYIDLYASLGERVELLLPKRIVDNLRNFVKLCYEEPDDPAKQQAEINKYILEFKEDLPGYIDVSLMLYPTQESKAYQYTATRQVFRRRLQNFIDTESLTDKDKEFSINILSGHDYSIGTPPVGQATIDFMSKILLGDSVPNIRKFRDVIGVVGDTPEAHWNYFMDILDQMTVQCTHYTKKIEVEDFLHRTEWAVNFKGLNGLIRTVVSGNSDTAVNLIKGEVFNQNFVQVRENVSADQIYKEMCNDTTSIFVIKVKHMRKNIFSGEQWFPFLTRLVIVDDSIESERSNTSLVFSLHNGIIKTLNKAHTKKLGAAANTQLNFRLILENVNATFLRQFVTLIEKKIADYEEELRTIQKEQTGEVGNIDKNIILYKFDEFSRQILKDKYSLEKLRDFIIFIENTKESDLRKQQTKELLAEFEKRTIEYTYSGIPEVHIAAILEGGGRNQIKTYGDYLLIRSLKNIDEKIVNKCKVILNIIPDNYKRTLKTHFHKNFGINLFLEKYKEYMSKIDNDADNKGRFANLLIDLGIKEDYDKLSEADQNIVKEFISKLGNSVKTSVSDVAQMIIRDLLFFKGTKPKPYILYNSALGWEYNDLFSESKFDINPFDIEIQNMNDGRIDFEKLIDKLGRIKSTLLLFDDSGNLWDRFSENLTIIINDPSNPTGYSDFNSEALKSLLRFVNNSKITLLLDEAYTDGVKIDNQEEPKWRTISRYIFNNIDTYAKIRAVSSLSTTKNLAATGNRLGSMVATPAMKEVIEYAKKLNQHEKGNSTSLLFLNNTLEIAQISKKVADTIDSRLPKDASMFKIREFIIDEIKKQIKIKDEELKQNKVLKKIAKFEGSPIHVFLLEELQAIDKLEVLGLPDDFNYNGRLFFDIYQEHIVSELNKFRVNKNFRSESLKRLKLAKTISKQVIEKLDIKDVEIINSDGSYLFNIILKKFSSYVDLELFCKRLSEQRGIAAMPYPRGIIRFSLGGYIQGSKQSYDIFNTEFEEALTIFLTYWNKFYLMRLAPENKGIQTTDLLTKLFYVKTDAEFLNNVLNDYKESKKLKRLTSSSLKINDIRSLYHADSSSSGVTINSIGNSKNSVIEFSEQVGRCTDVHQFIQSPAFTKVYENLLSQIYKNIPQLKYLDFNEVASKYSKATIQKYINNKKTFQPNYYVLDDPDEKNMMREILIEMENLLFADAKMKILALPATGNVAIDQAQLEGVNIKLKKFIQEILWHFNLQFQNTSIEPSRKQIIETTFDKFGEITELKPEEMDLSIFVKNLMEELRKDNNFVNSSLGLKFLGVIMDIIDQRILHANIKYTDKVLYLYLLKNDNSFIQLINDKLSDFEKSLQDCGSAQDKLISENILTKLFPAELDDVLDFIFRKQDIKIDQKDIHIVTRKVVLFFINLQNASKGTNYYTKYAHTLIKVVKSKFKQQNSSFNEMVQHGVTLHKNYETKNKVLETYNNGSLKWINDIMRKCGVIATEQAVQTHTRIATDAKKREYPFHKVDRDYEAKQKVFDPEKPNDFIKMLDTKPSSEFFARRLASFAQNMDTDDYRCKIINTGLVKELLIFQKSYIKYLTDSYRLFPIENITLQDVENFVPDVIAIFGAPEKLVSFPQVGLFNIDGPLGKIKTIVIPLKKEADYFGDYKKPRLLLQNEKVKDMGGIPKHGSLFAVEQEDGSVFVIEIDGDSGGGKSEMIAAMVIKWLKMTLSGIRSIKLIAGDMFHVFRDKEGNIYGIGTEVGDFSRTTDFDPDFIKYYRYLFESSADSNVEDLNARSTISGLCDISMPYKIDIMLAAANYARGEEAIVRIDNPENFLLYVDSTAERKEKATSQDGPNFYCTLRRYSDDKNIVEILDQHGNYIDDVLDWDLDKRDNQYYLASSYKLIDKINISDLVFKIFKDKKFNKDNKEYNVTDIQFDIINNRFIVTAINTENTLIDFVLTRNFFSAIFDSLASTPGGQPFVAESKEMENRHYLIDILKGGKDGKGKGKKIQCGVVSTEIGKKGKEIIGCQKAADGMQKLLQNFRANNTEANVNRNVVKRIINEKYEHIFKGDFQSSEIWRYNFYLFQHDLMRKAEFVRFDNPEVKVDLSGLRGFYPKDKNEPFCPLLITPNQNIEISSFSETFDELMSLPNYPEFAGEFKDEADKIYIATGYSEDTIINNMIVQLLLMHNYIDVNDLTRGKISEKLNRETIAAAKYAANKYYKKSKKTVEVQNQSFVNNVSETKNDEIKINEIKNENIDNRQEQKDDKNKKK